MSRNAVETFLEQFTRIRMTTLPVSYGTVACPFCEGTSVGSIVIDNDGRSATAHPCPMIKGRLCIDGRMSVRDAVRELIDLHVVVQTTQENGTEPFSVQESLGFLHRLYAMVRSS